MAIGKMKTMDGNTAAGSVAYRTNEVIAIYPITPSSTMGELCDEWAAAGLKNIWGHVPQVKQMQSEGGAAGAVHGALQAGSLSTTFTASQGLLLMIPNLYKIAGELTPFCMHVTARTLATHALSIFGDHSDVYACRQCGMALLCSNNPQEAQDFAAIGQAATLESRIPFMHYFDGFRTSHEVAKIMLLSDEELRKLLREDCIEAHRRRSLSPDHPVIRGTAQNPDAFFQAREACNGFYDLCAGRVQHVMDRFAKITGRQYGLFEWSGDANAERAIVIMGSGADVTEETVNYLRAHGEKVGVLKVHLYRPFDLEAFSNALPASVKKIAVLDRTKEPGAIGEPLYQDVVTALAVMKRGDVTVIGGRYGLASKEFTPSMVKSVFDELKQAKPQRQFTVGIVDDVTKLSLPEDRSFDIEPDDVKRAVFFGLGADGTVGANKNSIKIIGEETDLYAQGYFVYDSKKSGSVTVSHLRFGPRPIQSAYLVKRAHFVACHQFGLLEKNDVLGLAAEGATFLLNSPIAAERVWDQLPVEIQEQIVEKKLKFYVIDAYKVARQAGMGGRINTIMQTCFFALSKVIPTEDAIAKIRQTIEKTYGKKGPEVVTKNMAAVDQALEHLHEVKVPSGASATRHIAPTVPEEAPDFVKRVTAVMMEGKGDLLPVSAFPIDGSWPMGTSRWEKRAIAQEIPVWEPSICIQCNKCAIACPHAAIRPALFDANWQGAAPATFKSTEFKSQEMKGLKYALQVAPDDCTGCNLCIHVCPATDKKDKTRKAINMAPIAPIRDGERANWDFFKQLPEVDRSKFRLDVKGSQFLRPLIEFSGACSGCGETPYVKLLTQLFGDRALIANATGCSSIYGGNLPTTPYCQNAEGRGPAWCNSLFEDNAEFGLGMRLSIDQQRHQAAEILHLLRDKIGAELVDSIVSATQKSEAEVFAQRKRVAQLKEKLAGIEGDQARRLLLVADYLVKKDVWIVGGDGWAYDIGFGGLDHVLSSGRDVNILVLDTEVYSNTGGQSSKATPLGASAKFATAGKETFKKDLARIAMLYGNVYVATVAMGAKDVQTVKAFTEAESYPGVSLIIAYSHCIAHGYDMASGPDHQKMVVDSGIWPLFRFDPRRELAGQNPFQLDSSAPKVSVEEFAKNETRYRMVEQQNPEHYHQLLAAAQKGVTHRWHELEQLAKSNGSITAEASGNGNGKTPVAAAEKA